MAKVDSLLTMYGELLDVKPGLRAYRLGAVSSEQCDAGGQPESRS
jgi:hypothetical protein